MSDYITLAVFVIILIPATLWLRKFFDSMDNYEKKEQEENETDTEGEAFAPKQTDKD